MSASYTAVGWNRQKKIYDGLMAACCIGYLIFFVGISSTLDPQITFETLLLRSTSTLAVLILHVILAIGPLCRLNTKFLPLLYNRRHLGVTMFLFALVHATFGIIQFHSHGNVNPFLSLFLSNTTFGSLHAFPFQLLGLLALIILFLMAVTSHDFWLHNLSPAVWKALHMLVYLAYFLVVMHIMLGVIQYEQNPVFVMVVVAGGAVLISLHLLAARKEARTDNKKFTTGKQGFVYICQADEIAESRAKIFCIHQERIAVYKHGQKLYAVHNVCKHQGGPLGEGKILDGCITCPWHGYQYLPQTGQSPPPFTEKVSTYEVWVENEKVWLNPTPKSTP